MTLYWDNCRLIFCLFPGTSFPFYLQSAVMTAFYITNELARRNMDKRWKIRLYIDKATYDSNEFSDILKLFSKCDVEIFPITLPYANTSPRWYTALRYILPAQDSNLDAFRTLDTHYLWTMEDIDAVVNALQSWERSNKRCCIWKYPNRYSARPYAAGLFGMNISQSSSGEDVSIRFDFLVYMLRRLHPRIDSHLSSFRYGDDEYLLELLMHNYFVDSDGNLKESLVYYLPSCEWNYISVSKRAESVNIEVWLSRYRKVINFILSNGVRCDLLQYKFLFSNCKSKFV